MNQTGKVVTQQIPAGTFVFLEGDQDGHFYVIQSGEIEIFTQTRDGHHVTVAKFGPGDSFGEFAFLDRAPRSASARAMVDSEVAKISEEAYLELLNELPDWAKAMLKSFAARLKQMTERLKDLPQFTPNSPSVKAHGQGQAAAAGTARKA